MKIILFYLTIFLLTAPAIALEISTNAKLVGDIYYVVKGEKVDILISGLPSEELDVSIHYKFILEAPEYKYYFSQNKFPIPISSKFEVKAYPVKNLTVEAKLWIFRRVFNSEAKNDVASIKADVPAGKYDVKFYGISKGDHVTIDSLAVSKVKLNDEGKFSLSYDTSYLPEGEMNVRVDSKLLKVKIVGNTSKTFTPTQTPMPTPTLNDTQDKTLIEIEPSWAVMEVNKTLNLTVKIKRGILEPLLGFTTLWSVNNSAVELVKYESKTNNLGETTATIKAISPGVAMVKAEIPDLNVSAVAFVYVQNETTSMPPQETPYKTLTPQINENNTPNNVETPKNEKTEKRYIIPGFDVLTAILSILTLCSAIARFRKR